MLEVDDEHEEFEFELNDDGSASVMSQEERDENVIERHLSIDGDIETDSERSEEDDEHLVEYDFNWMLRTSKEVQRRRVEERDLRWSTLLDLWQEKIRDERVEFDLITMGAENGALRAIQQFTWLGGFSTNGRICFEVLRAFGGRLVDKELTSKIFWSEFRQRTLLSDDDMNELFPADSQESAAQTLLSDIRTCSVQDLVRRLEEEETLGFTLAALRLNKYSDEEIKVLSFQMIDRLQLRAPDVEKKILDLVRDERFGDLKALLETCADMYLRNLRIFKEAQQREFKIGSSPDFIIVDVTSRNDRSTKIDRWFARGARDAITPAVRKQMIEAEKSWYEDHRTRVLQFCGKEDMISKIDLKPKIFDIKVLLKDLGTQRDTLTAKLRQYATKKDTLRQLKKKAMLQYCLTEACEATHQYHEDEEKDEEFKSILVVGFSQNDGRVVPHVGATAPVVVRHVPISIGRSDTETDGPNNGVLVEIGSRLDGQYISIPSSLCGDAADRIKDSALPISAKDHLVFCEFVPDEEHVPGSMPLETFIRSPPLELFDDRTMPESISILPSERSSSSLKPPLSPSKEAVKGPPSANRFGKQNDGVHSLQQFTHILLEIPDVREDKRREPEHDAYSEIKDSGSRYLVSLDQSGRVDMEGVRLPSLPVLPRSSVAQRQGALSFRRFALLLPASIEGKDDSFLELPKEIRFVESGETLAQLMSIKIECDKHHNENEAVESLVESRMRNNPLLLNCMSVRSLSSISSYFQRGVQSVWTSILGINQVWQDRDEQTASEVLYYLIVGDIVGNTGGTMPYPCALAIVAFWDCIPRILRKRTQFNSEFLEVEPSNFQSVMLQLERRKETSVPHFFFVQLSGQVTLTMIEKLIICAKESVSVKLVVQANRSVIKLISRLSNEVKGLVYQHPKVISAMEITAPLIVVESRTLLGATTKASLHLNNRNALAESWRTYAEEIVKRKSAWWSDIMNWLSTCFSAYQKKEQLGIERNTMVLTGQDPVEVGHQIIVSNHGQNFNIKLINARDSQCFVDLHSYLGTHFNPTNQTTEQFSVVALQHAQLLSQDRLSVVAARCSLTLTPLVLIPDCPTRDITYLCIRDDQGYPSYKRIPILNFRPILRSPSLKAEGSSTFSTIRRIVLGFRMLLGPDVFITENDFRLLLRTMQPSESIDVRSSFLQGFSYLKDFPRFDSNGPECLERIWKIFEGDNLPIWVTECSETNSPQYLGDLVAGVVRLYLDYFPDTSEPADRLGTVSFSFPEFVKQGVLLLCSQEVRVEMFLRSLLQRLPPVDSVQRSVKYIEDQYLNSLQRCFCLQSSEGELNVGFTKHPGPILCAPLLLDRSAFGVVVSRSVYCDPGRGESLSETAERNSLDCTDLNWNHLFSTWSRAADVPGPVLEYMLEESPMRLLLVLSLSKNKISSLRVTERMCNMLENDLAQAICILESTFSRDLCAELDERMAALTWILVRHGSKQNRSHIEHFEPLVTSYLRSRLHFDFGSDRTLGALLLNCLIGLDQPKSALVDQPTVVTFLLEWDNKEIVENLLPAAPKIGAAFVMLCINSDWREELKLYPTFVRDCMEPLISWVTGAALTNTDVEKRLDSLLVDWKYEDWWLRLTPAALAELVFEAVKKALRDKQLFVAVVERFFLRLLQKHGDFEFLKAFVKNLAGDFSQLRIRACIVTCEVLLLKDPSFRPWISKIEWNSAIDDEKVLKILLDSLMTNKLQLNLLTPYQRKVSLVSSETLMELYLNSFQSEPGDESMESDMTMHKAFFESEAERGDFLSYIISCQELSFEDRDRERNMRILWLVWYLWSKLPARHLGNRLMPHGREEFDIFKSIVKEDLFKAIQSCETSLSLLAKLSTMPHTLPETSLLALREKIGSPVKESCKIYTLAQKNSDRYPEYTLRVDLRRGLPRKCIEYVCKEAKSFMKEYLEQVNSHSVFPRIQDGFGSRSLASNLALLCKLKSASKAFDESIVEHYGLSILAWLKSSGILPRDVYRVIKGEKEWVKSLSKLLSRVQTLGRESKGESFVYAPMPIFVAVHYVEEKENRMPLLFESNTDSVQVTAQSVFLLAQLFESQVESDVASKKFEVESLTSRVLKISDLNQAEAQKECAAVLRELFEYIGFALRDKIPLQPGVVLPIATFVSQIRTLSLLATLFDALLDGILESGTPHIETLIPQLFDWLFVFVGITPSNNGVQLLSMFKTFESKRVENNKMVPFVGSQVSKELQFMVENVFEKHSSDLRTNSQTMLGLISDKNVCGAEKIIRRERSDGGVVFDFVQGYLENLLEVLMNPNTRNKSTVDGDSNYSDCIVDRLLPFRSAEERNVNVKDQRLENNSERLVEGSHNKHHVQQRKLFISPLEDFSGGDGGTHYQSGVPTLHGDEEGREMILPKLVSARSLLLLRSLPSYGILQVAPGLHPVLRKPLEGVVDEEFARHRPLLSSFDEDDELEHGSIAHVFSNNGETWELLQQLPVDSTISCRGFYLRKSMQGKLALLMSTSDTNEVHLPPFFLADLLDTHLLAGLHLDENVVKLLGGLVKLSFLAAQNQPQGQNQNHDESTMGEVMDAVEHGSEDEGMRANELNIEEGNSADHDSFAFPELVDNELEVLNVLDFVREMKLHSHRRRAKEWLKLYLDIEKNLVQSLLNEMDGVRDHVSHGYTSHIIQGLLDTFPNRCHSMDPVIESLETQISIIMAMTSPISRSELKFSLIQVYNNHMKRSPETSKMLLSEGDEKANRLIAPHAHILQEKFRKASIEILRGIEIEPIIEGERTYTEEFADSDSEDEGHNPKHKKVDRKVEVMGLKWQRNGETDTLIEESMHRLGETALLSDEEFPDSFLDFGKSCTGFPHRSVGYGRYYRTTVPVWTLHGTTSPLYFVPINTRELKLSYSDASGLPIGFVFHRRILAKRLKQAADQFEEPNPEYITALRDKLLRWLANLARSPLPASVKQFMIETLRNGTSAHIAPSLNGRLGNSGEESGHDDSDDINLVVIQNCIAASLPAEEPVRKILTSTYSIPHFVRSLIVRANDRGHDTYGVHIVKPILLEELRKYNVRPQMCELGHDSLINARDVSSMYLKIVECFNEHTWLVWVRGLSTIPDQLLKWIAEYTKYHPWRFVYLEDCDVSWNFGENRDRCVLTRAPPTIASFVRRKEDLEKPFVKSHRPCHSFEAELSDKLKSVFHSKAWRELQKSTYAFFEGEIFKATEIEEDLTDHHSKLHTWYPREDGEVVGAGGEGNLSPNSNVSNGHNQEEQQYRSPWDQFLKSKGNADYRDEVREYLCQEASCAVLLVSPPGAGKSYFSKEISSKLEEDYGLMEAYVDGSDDELVYTALLSVLNRKVPIDTRVFLIIDEYHMLSSQHKKDLFQWLRMNIGRLHVLMIANRKDASDDAYLDLLRDGAVEQGNVHSLDARLPKSLISEVIVKNKVVQSEMVNVWFHLSRSLFGGESISLRFLATLDLVLIGDKSTRLKRLEHLLASKLPRISSLSVQDFVLSFLAATRHLEEVDRRAIDVAVAVKDVSKSVGGPISTMVQAALLTYLGDRGLDFPSFVENQLRGANDVPPSIKMASWCCLMQSACDMESICAIESMSPPASLFERLFIDQVGFPHQLLDTAPTLNSTVLTFSWGGSYESLADMTDAVRRGHSINWQDVYLKEWAFNEVTSLPELVVLLSACRRPGGVLNALKPGNLVALLQGSLSDDSLKLAQFILAQKVGLSDAEVQQHESPYNAAVWTVLTCETRALNLDSFCPGLVPVHALANALKWAPLNVSSLTECRAKDIHRRTLDVTALLAGLSNWYIKQNSPHSVPKLWRGFFSCLIEPQKIPGIAQLIAEYEPDEQAGWSPEMYCLWKIAKGLASLDDIRNIWSDYRKCMLVDSTEPKPPIHSIFATGLVLSNCCQIPDEIQHYILLTSTTINLDKVTLDQVDIRLRLGIDQLKNDVSPQVSIQPQSLNSFVTKLLAA